MTGEPIRTLRSELIDMLDEALGDDPRLALSAARQLGEEQEWLVHRAVWAARNQGYTWGRIGRLLGMTRQGANKRFPDAPPAAPPNAARALAAARERRSTEELIARLRQRQS